MKLFIVVYLVASVNCKPHYLHQDGTSAIEIEKQELIEYHSPTFKITKKPDRIDNSQQNANIHEKTKEILSKIEQVNRNQGLVGKDQTKYQQPPNNNNNDKESTLIITEKLPEKNTGVKFQTSHQIPTKVDNSLKQSTGANRPKMIHPQDQEQLVSVWPQYLIASGQPYNVNGKSYYQIVPQEQNQHLAQLKSQTVDNIKSIIGQSQYPYYTGFVQTVPSYFVPHYVQYNGNYPQLSTQSNPHFLMPYYSDDNNQMQSFSSQRQWQSPLAQYFPIIIRDPLLQMFNAVSNMVGYGPEATLNPMCRKEFPFAINTSPTDVTSTKGRNLKLDNSKRDDPIIRIQVVRSSEDDTKRKSIERRSKMSSTTWKPPQISHLEISKEQVRASTPKLFAYEISAPNLRERSGERWSIKGAFKTNTTPIPTSIKKVFSKDNAGSGIFIHKLKVRRGGVAIAGPGGIATAGSGGTAIVGPNGYALTKPDSLAIAGSGTKVIAVEPEFEFAEILNNTSQISDLPTARIGRLVAIGPVIYYNKG